jgi:hypothetical protein
VNRSGNDLAPKGSMEGRIPKGLAWVLGAEKTRQEYMEKKRKRATEEDDEGKGKKRRRNVTAKTDMKIQVGYIKSSSCSC